MSESTEFLLAVFNEQMAQARWHEEQREKVSALVFAGSAALLGLGVTAERWQHPAFTLVVALGLIGTVIALKHYERNRRHVYLARSLRERLDTLLPDAGVGPIMRSGLTYDSAACRLLERVRLYLLWSMLTAFVACLGLVLLVVSVLSSHPA